MKVLYISGGDDKYGAPKAMMEMIETLHDLYGVEPVILTKRKNLVNQWCDQHGYENYSFWYRDTMTGSAYSSLFLNIIKHFIKFILYIYGSFTQKNILNIINNLDSIDLIHTNLNRIDIGDLITKKYSIPQICHLRELRSGHSKIIQYNPLCIKNMNNNNSLFFAISDITSRNWRDKGILEEKIQIVYDGIDLGDLLPIEHKTQEESLTIVCVGRIERNKGQMQIIEAVNLLTDEIKDKIKIIFVGESYKEYRRLLEQKIKKYNLNDKVVFYGYCRDLPQILAKCDIGITASKGEAFGRVTVEYMAAGLVTIASDTGANPEIIKDGVNGYLYQYENSEDLSRKIYRSFVDRNECEHIIKNAKQSVKKFSKENNAKKIYDHYIEIVNKL